MSRCRSINSPHVVFPGAMGVTATHADAIRFNTTAGAPANPQAGDVWWDAASGTLSIQTVEELVVLQMGQEQHVPVINRSGAQIDNGDLVYISGSDVGLPTIDPAVADGTITPDVVIGFATHDIDDDATGIVTTFGRVHDVNTLGCLAGDKIYLSPTAPGEWTTTKPIAPQQVALVGYVMIVDEFAGVILCRVQFTDTEIHALNVSSTNPTAGTYSVLGHYDQIVAGQAIPQGSPYVSADEMCNAEMALNLTVVSAPLTLRIDGDSVNETTGAITPGDFATIPVTDTGWHRFPKKWIDKPSVSVVEVGESVTAAIYRHRYWDGGNEDFRLLSFRWEFTPNAAAWTFAFTISRLNTDGSLELLETKSFAQTDSPVWAVNGEVGTFKLGGLTYDVLGSGAEGLVVELSATNIRYLYGDLKYTHL